MKRFVTLRQFAIWRRHAPAAFLALSVALGQSLVWFLSALPLALAISLVGILILGASPSSMRVLLAGLFLGICSALCVSSGPARITTAHDVTLLGAVTGSPRHPIPGEVVFYLNAALGDQDGVLRCRAVELPWRNSAALEQGDLIWVRGDVEAVARDRNPITWGSSLFRRGVSGELRARFVSKPLARRPSWNTTLRERLKHLVFSASGQSEGSGLFLSMALGYQDLISLSVEKAFKRLGLTHLLVVSGYQVSLLFGFVLSVFMLLPLRLLPTGRLARRLLYVGALLVASCYVFCIGLEMSAVRALVAAACLTAQMVSERGSSFAQRWGVALLMMEMIWPWCFFEIGVILTFAALFGIGLGARLGGSRGVKALIYVNSCVWLCTSLVIVMWSGMLSPLGLLVNILVAAPWSIANCAVGISALGALAAGIPGATSVIQLLAWVNHKLSMLVLEISDWRFSGVQLEGFLRTIVACVLGMMLLGLVRSASRVRVDMPS